MVVPFNCDREDQVGYNKVQMNQIRHYKKIPYRNNPRYNWNIKGVSKSFMKDFVKIENGEKLPTGVQRGLRGQRLDSLVLLGNSIAESHRKQSHGTPSAAWGRWWWGGASCKGKQNPNKPSSNSSWPFSCLNYLRGRSAGVQQVEVSWVLDSLLQVPHEESRVLRERE